MKKKLKYFLLSAFLTGIFSSAHAQIPVVDALSNKQLVSEILKWVQDYAKQKLQDARLQKIMSENTSTREKLGKLLELKQQVEKELYLAKDFRKLRFSDLTKIRQQVYGLASTDKYVTEVPYVAEFVSITSRTATVDNAKQAYNYLFDGTSAYRPENSGTLNGFVAKNKQQKAKQYSLAIAAQKRKMAVAMSYEKLSEEYKQLAQDLSDQVGKDGEQKMSTGERIKAQKLASDYMVKSLEMKHKLDQLLKEASQKSAVVQQVDNAYQASLVRKELSKVIVE
ncbi:hypothetical protein [Xanthocytophaga agilis]|uniref:Uncharacterized protein n=1 Tax=Xanthocytophaga agilis TaxID=3048010 RepID=A0AAE3UJJ3_9BACT|nr:hypothetical protein [Xanthocytophaga agilis]MDJ1505233.1 hypothetical protein [Xanthocytophaga agilis]